MALKIPVKVQKVLHSSTLTTDQKWAQLKKMSIRRSNPVKCIGAFLEVLVFPEFVIKRDRKHPRLSYRTSTLDEDAAYFQKMRKGRYKKYFPETVMCGPFQIQEALKTSEYLWYKYELTILQLESRFGLGDLHDENVGWKKDGRGKWYPVIFDVNLCW